VIQVLWLLASRADQSLAPCSGGTKERKPQAIVCVGGPVEWIACCSVLGSVAALQVGSPAATPKTFSTARHVSTMSFSESVG
jgi:hypothetical protein